MCEKSKSNIFTRFFCAINIKNTRNYARKCVRKINQTYLHTFLHLKNLFYLLAYCENLTSARAGFSVAYILLPR